MTRRLWRLLLGVLAGALVGGALLVGGMRSETQGDAEATAPTAGPPDLDAYCRSEYGERSAAHLLSRSANGWFCSTTVGGVWTVVAADVVAACRDQYGASSRAEVGSVDDPRSWECLR